MNRRIALTVAGATAVVVTAASAAMAANVGILGSGPAQPAGRLTAANVAELAVPRPTQGAAIVGDPSGPAGSDVPTCAPTPCPSVPVTIPTTAGGADVAPSPGSSPAAGSSPSSPSAPLTTVPGRPSSPPSTIPTPPTTRRSDDREKEREREEREDEDEDEGDDDD